MTSPPTAEVLARQQERRLQLADKEVYVVTIAAGVIAHPSELLLAEPAASDSPLVDPEAHRPVVSDHDAPEQPAEEPAEARADGAAPDPVADVGGGVGVSTGASHDGGESDGN